MILAKYSETITRHSDFFSRLHAFMAPNVKPMTAAAHIANKTPLQVKSPSTAMKMNAPIKPAAKALREVLKTLVIDIYD